MNDATHRQLIVSFQQISHLRLNSSYPIHIFFIDTIVKKQMIKWYYSIWTNLVLQPSIEVSILIRSDGKILVIASYFRLCCLRSNEDWYSLVSILSESQLTTASFVIFFSKNSPVAIEHRITKCMLSEERKQEEKEDFFLCLDQFSSALRITHTCGW